MGGWYGSSLHDGEILVPNVGQIMMPENTETTLNALNSGHTAASWQLLGSANSSRRQLSIDIWQWWSASQADVLEVVLHMGLLEVTYQRYLS